MFLVTCRCINKDNVVCIIVVLLLYKLKLEFPRVIECCTSQHKFESRRCFPDIMFMVEVPREVTEPLVARP